MRRMISGALVLSAFGVALACAAPVLAAIQPAPADEILTLVNQQRAAAGVGPLRLQSQLMQSAQSYANYLANGGAFSHTGSDGSTPFTRMAAAGYQGPYMGENIAKGFSTAQMVMDAWMNSPGHRANILNPNFTDLGVGVSGDAWVQDFGAGGSSSAPSSPGSEAPPPPQPLGPQITGIQPTYARMGDPVAISGQRFGSSGTVSFGGGMIGEPSSWTDNRIDVPVPLGSQSGMVYVQTDQGTSAGSLFYVLNPTGDEPFIQRLSPTEGAPGTQVTIYGQRLGSTQGLVTFGGVPAPVIYWSPSGYYIRCYVPAGGQSGDLAVTRANDGQKTNAISFTVDAGAQASSAPQPPAQFNPQPGPSAPTYSPPPPRLYYGSPSGSYSLYRYRHP